MRFYVHAFCCFFIATGVRPISADDDLGKATKAVVADEAVEALLERIRLKHRTPGMIGAIVAGDRLESIGAVGVRKIGSRERLTVDDRMHLGSCTKAMTATMIGTLVDEKTLNWDSTISDVFPKLSSELHEDYRRVTLTQLLTHRAGLPANGPWWKLGEGISNTERRRVLLKKIMSQKPKHAPGSKFLYSNVGFAIAGLMAEETTGKSWETLMEERLFEPLEMKSAGFGFPGMKDRVDQPWGHALLPAGIRQPLQHDNHPSLGPAGTVHASLEDWGKFISLHLEGARGGKRMLKPETFRTLHTPPEGAEYAKGWMVVEREWAGGRTLTHSGSNTMWFAVVWLAPKRNFAVLIATNQGGPPAAKACDEAASALIVHHLKSAGLK